MFGEGGVKQGLALPEFWRKARFQVTRGFLQQQCRQSLAAQPPREQFAPAAGSVKSPGFQGQQQRAGCQVDKEGAATYQQAKATQRPGTRNPFEQLEHDLLVLDFLGKVPEEQTTQSGCTYATQLGLTVTIAHKGDKGGEIRIAYKQLEQLDDVCRKLGSTLLCHHQSQ